jgi:hypothetical protein
MPDDEVSFNPPNKDLAEPDVIGDDEVKLSDGRIVKMRETTGADEAAVVRILGNHVSLDGAGGQVLIQANALKSVVSIDGQAPPIMASYNDYMKFARMFTTKNLARLTRKYVALNMEINKEVPLA